MRLLIAFYVARICKAIPYMGRFDVYTVGRKIMVREMKLVVAILKAVAHNRYSNSETLGMVKRIVTEETGCTSNILDLHIALLIDSEFIKATPQELQIQKDNPLLGLTWNGFDLLENLQRQYNEA